MRRDPSLSAASVLKFELGDEAASSLATEVEASDSTRCGGY